MYRKLMAVLVGAGVAIGLTLLVPGTASATQVGLQQIRNPTNSQSGYIVRFPNGCGDFGVNPGTTAGEGYSYPRCGGISGSNSEPGWVWIGPGWCATRTITDHTTGSTYEPQNLMAGGGGYWFRLWQPNMPWTDGGYTNNVRAWHGTGCPTTGGAWVDNNPDGDGFLATYYWQT